MDLMSNMNAYNLINSSQFLGFYEVQQLNEQQSIIDVVNFILKDCFSNFSYLVLLI